MPVKALAVSLIAVLGFFQLGIAPPLPQHPKLSVQTVIYYWNLESEPEGLEGAKRILEELKPDMIWYAHWVTGFPMPPNARSAYRIARQCGLSDEEAKRFQEWCEAEAYTLEHVRRQVEAVGSGCIYCPCILGYSNFRTDFNFDPLTFKPYSKEKIRSMLLNFGKWGIVNPQTGKPYTLEETQRLLCCDLGPNRGIPGLSSQLVIEYYVGKAEALYGVGVRAVWFDLFFQMPWILAKRFGFNHPMVRDLYSGACVIVERARMRGLIVGTWIVALMFPYEHVPKVDFVTASPTVKEVLSLQLNYTRWKRIAEIIKAKRPGIPLIIILDFANRDDLPLPVFSQRLSPEQQSRFLEKLAQLAKRLEKDTGVRVVVAYPIHGPGLGKNPVRLAWGRYRLYDATAPEFNAYDTIKRLITEERGGDGESSALWRQVQLVLLAAIAVVAMALVFYAIARQRSS